MIGAEALVQTLLAFNARHVFNLPGVGMFPVIEELHKRQSEIRYITALNEIVLAAMADGYGCAAGQPAFVNVYHATGTALALFGLITAWANNSPLVLTTTVGDRQINGREMHSAIPGPLAEMTRQFTKWSWEVPTAERLPEAIARAFTIAATPPQGPVHLAFPYDLYTEEIGAVSIPDASRFRVLARQAPDSVGVAAADLLRAAAFPVMVAGREVASSRAEAQLFALAEELAAPVFSEQLIATARGSTSAA